MGSLECSREGLLESTEKAETQGLSTKTSPWGDPVEDSKVQETQHSPSQEGHHVHLPTPQEIPEPGRVRAAT